MLLVENLTLYLDYLPFCEISLFHNKKNSKVRITETIHPHKQGKTMRCKYYYPLKKDHESRTYTSDICIYGATASGIVAAVEAARSGKKVNLVEFSRFIGGMTTSGLSATDIGDKDAIGGITLEFHKELGNIYGTEEHWFFEPHVALSILRDWLERYKVNLYREQRLMSVEMSPERRITGLITESGIFSGHQYISMRPMREILWPLQEFHILQAVNPMRSMVRHSAGYTLVHLIITLPDLWIHTGFPAIYTVVCFLEYVHILQELMARVMI